MRQEASAEATGSRLATPWPDSFSDTSYTPVSTYDNVYEQASCLALCQAGAGEARKSHQELPSPKGVVSSIGRASADERLLMCEADVAMLTGMVHIAVLAVFQFCVGATCFPSRLKCGVVAVAVADARQKRQGSWQKRQGSRQRVATGGGPASVCPQVVDAGRSGEHGQGARPGDAGVVPPPGVSTAMMAGDVNARSDRECTMGRAREQG
jgi:hypothetical protein